MWNQIDCLGRIWFRKRFVEDPFNRIWRCYCLFKARRTSSNLDRLLWFKSRKTNFVLKFRLFCQTQTVVASHIKAWRLEFHHKTISGTVVISMTYPSLLRHQDHLHLWLTLLSHTLQAQKYYIYWCSSSCLALVSGELITYGASASTHIYTYWLDYWQFCHYASTCTSS